MNGSTKRTGLGSAEMRPRKRGSTRAIVPRSTGSARRNVATYASARASGSGGRASRAGREAHPARTRPKRQTADLRTALGQVTRERLGPQARACLHRRVPLGGAPIELGAARDLLVHPEALEERA